VLLLQQVEDVDERDKTGHDGSASDAPEDLGRRAAL